MSEVPCESEEGRQHLAGGVEQNFRTKLNKSNQDALEPTGYCSMEDYLQAPIFSSHDWWMSLCPRKARIMFESKVIQAVWLCLNAISSAINSCNN